MRKKYLKMFVGLLFCSNIFGQNIPNYIPSNGLVGWWPFNGNPNDESGNGNNGIVNGATLTSDRNSINNTCYNFDGVSNYIKITDNNLMDFNNKYSISAWVNLTKTPSSQFSVVSKERQLDGTGFSMIVDNTGKITQAFNNGGNYVTTSLKTLSNTTWYNIVFTYDGSTAKIYVNGVLDKSNTFSQSLINSTFDWFIGKEFTTNGGGNSGYTNRYFKGKIDDIGMWNRALTQQEITTIYQSCVTPTVTISPQSSTTICQGNNVILNTLTGNNYTYQWYLNNQAINSANSSSYQATLAGNYTVKITDGACSATSAPTTVTVNQLPSSNVSTSGPTTFCQGGNVTLTAQGTGTYQWSNSSTSQNIIVSQSGSYFVTVTQNGCSVTSNQINVTVKPNPTITISTSGPTTFCQGNSVSLIANGAETYSWSNNAITAKIDVSNSGNYTVTGTLNGCSSSNSQLVTVNQNPIVTLASINAFINNKSNLINLNGTPSGGTFSGIGVNGTSFNPQVSGLGQKVITYNYTDLNNCSGSAQRSTIVYDTTGIICTSTKYDTITTHISVTDTLIIKAHFAGLNNVHGTTEIKIYPNPTSDIIYINTGDFTNISSSTIKISNSIGQTVFSSLINQPLFTVNVNQLGAKGTYTVQIIDNKQKIQNTKTIVIE